MITVDYRRNLCAPQEDLLVRRGSDRHDLLGLTENNMAATTVIAYGSAVLRAGGGPN
jgi:hypothetical protein